MKKRKFLKWFSAMSGLLFILLVNCALPLTVNAANTKKTGGYWLRTDIILTPPPTTDEKELIDNYLNGKSGVSANSFYFRGIDTSGDPWNGTMRVDLSVLPEMLFIGEKMVLDLRIEHNDMRGVVNRTLNVEAWVQWSNASDVLYFTDSRGSLRNTPIVYSVDNNTIPLEEKLTINVPEYSSNTADAFVVTITGFNANNSRGENLKIEYVYKWTTGKTTVDTQASTTGGDMETVIPISIGISVLSALGALASISSVDGGDLSEDDRKKKPELSMVLSKDFGRNIRINESRRVKVKIVDAKEGDMNYAQYITGFSEKDSKGKYLDVREIGTEGVYKVFGITPDPPEELVGELMYENKSYSACASFKFGKGDVYFQNNVEFIVMDKPNIYFDEPVDMPINELERKFNLFCRGFESEPTKFELSPVDGGINLVMKINGVDRYGVRGNEPFSPGVFDEDKGEYGEYIETIQFMIADRDYEKVLKYGRCITSFNYELQASYDKGYSEPLRFKVTFCRQGIDIYNTQSPDDKKLNVFAIRKADETMEETLLAIGFGIWQVVGERLKFVIIPAEPEILSIDCRELEKAQDGFTYKNRERFKAIGLEWEPKGLCSDKSTLNGVNTHYLYSFKAKKPYGADNNLPFQIEIESRNNCDIRQVVGISYRKYPLKPEYRIDDEKVISWYDADLIALPLDKMEKDKSVELNKCRKIIHQFVPTEEVMVETGMVGCVYKLLSKGNKFNAAQAKEIKVLLLNLVDTFENAPGIGYKESFELRRAIWSSARNLVETQSKDYLYQAEFYDVCVTVLEWTAFIGDIALTFACGGLGPWASMAIQNGKDILIKVYDNVANDKDILEGLWLQDLIQSLENFDDLDKALKTGEKTKVFKWFACFIAYRLTLNLAKEEFNAQGFIDATQKTFKDISKKSFEIALKPFLQKKITELPGDYDFINFVGRLVQMLGLS